MPILTQEQALNAIYFDFEGCRDQAPSLLGFSYLCSDLSECHRQYIVESKLWPASGRIIPHTNGKIICGKSTLDQAVLQLYELATERNCLLVSWSNHDSNIIDNHVSNDLIKALIKTRYVNALPTARQWLRLAHPSIQLEKGYGGKNKLSVYARLMGINIPDKYGSGVAASGIKQMREALAVARSFSNISKEARDAWQALLGHNKFDCKVTSDVVIRAASEYAELSK